MVVKKTTLISMILVLVCAVIVGMRGQTNDTQVYANILHYIDLYDLRDYQSFYKDTGVEIGIGWYFYFISRISYSNFLSFFLISLISFYLLYKNSVLLKASPVLVIILYIFSGYFIFQQFMQIRQGLVTVLILYGAIQLFNRKFFTAIILFILSILFHQVSIVPIFISILLFFLLEIFKINLKAMLFTSIFGMLFTFLISKLLLLNFLLESSSRVEEYSKMSDYSKGVSILGFNNVRIFLIYILFFILIQKIDFGGKHKYLNKEKIYFLFLYFSFGVGLKFGLSSFDILSNRLSSPFIFVELYLIVILFLNSVKRDVFFYIVLSIYFIWAFIPSYFIQNNMAEFINLYFTPLK